jgi:hypothetical protein
MKKIYFLSLVFAFAAVNLQAVDVTVLPPTGADGELTLKAAIEGAGVDDVIVLEDGTYNYGDVSIALPSCNTLTIKAANEGKAVLSLVQFNIPANVTIGELTIDGLTASHDGVTDSKYFLQVNTATSVCNKLTVKNCIVDGFSRGVFRATTAGAVIGTMSVENCTFIANTITNQAGYGHFNLQKCSLTGLTVRNCTFYNSPAALLRHGDEPSSATILFENCTLLKCGSSAARKMIELGSNLTNASVNVKNCIFSGSYDEVAPNKPIDLKNFGTVENSILENYSDPLTTNTTTDVASAGSVTAYAFNAFTMATDPATLTGIGDLRWQLNGVSNGLVPVDVQKQTRSELHFDLLGRKVNPATTKNTVLIKQTIYTDGSVSSEKIMSRD